MPRTIPAAESPGPGSAAAGAAFPLMADAVAAAHWQMHLDQPADEARNGEKILHHGMRLNYATVGADEPELTRAKEEQQLAANGGRREGARRPAKVSESARAGRAIAWAFVRRL